MGNLRKTVSANLGEVSDKDLIEYFKKMNKKGINDSKLIKQAVRFYKDNCGKVAQLNEVDVANIIDKEDIKTHITDVVNELIKSGSLISVAPVAEKKTRRTVGSKTKKSTENATIAEVSRKTKSKTVDSVDDFIEHVKSGLDDGTVFNINNGKNK